MGIKNLLYFLSNYSNIINETDNESYNGKRIAIDISILIYQVVIGFRNTGSDIINNDGQIISHILGLFNKTLYFLNKNIIPIYVFDGKPPKLKQKLLKLRKYNRMKALNAYYNLDINNSNKIKYFKKSVYITQDQMNQCRELLNLMGIPYINAPEEADSQLSYLCKSNMVYAVFTEDMDILTFGSPIIIKNFTSPQKKFIEIKLDNILNELNLTYNEFIELCILFGCDYCHHIINIKPQDIYKIYIKHKSIEKTLEEIKNMGYYVSKYYDYKSAFNYFTDSKYIPIQNDQLKLSKPNIEKLFNILINKYNLNKDIISTKLIKLNNYYNKLKII